MHHFNWLILNGNNSLKRHLVVHSLDDKVFHCRLTFYVNPWIFAFLRNYLMLKSQTKFSFSIRWLHFCLKADDERVLKERKI